MKELPAMNLCSVALSFLYPQLINRRPLPVLSRHSLYSASPLKQDISKYCWGFESSHSMNFLFMVSLSLNPLILKGCQQFNTMCQCYFIPNNMEPFFLLFLLHSSVFLVSSDCAAFLSSKFPFGKGCADKISFPVLSKHSDPADTRTAERESIPAKRNSQSRGRTVMDSGKHKAMIINDTDNGSEQSAAISRELGAGSW